MAAYDGGVAPVDVVAGTLFKAGFTASVASFLLVYAANKGAVSNNAAVAKPAGGSDVRTYYLRAWDSGTAGYVTWQSVGTPTSLGSPGLAPSSGQTTPNYSGSLSAVRIETYF